jgi:hypothetical protein
MALTRKKALNKWGNHGKMMGNDQNNGIITDD